MMWTKTQGAEFTGRGATATKPWSHHVDMDGEDDSALDDGPDWYVREWGDRLGKKQAGLVSELNIHKNTAHRLWTGKQPYRRDFVNAISRWFNIEPYELLMPPDEAIALRRIRETAMQIAADERERLSGETPVKRAG